MSNAIVLTDRGAVVVLAESGRACWRALFANCVGTARAAATVPRSRRRNARLARHLPSRRPRTGMRNVTAFGLNRGEPEAPQALAPAA
jgi:hypothetical protein